MRHHLSWVKKIRGLAGDLIGLRFVFLELLKLRQGAIGQSLLHESVEQVDFLLCLGLKHLNNRGHEHVIKLAVQRLPQSVRIDGLDGFDDALMGGFGAHDLGYDVVDGVLVVVDVLDHHALVDDLHEVVVELERGDRVLVAIHIVRRLREKGGGHHLLGDVRAHFVDAHPFVGVSDHQVQ